MAPPEKRCLYEILGLQLDCTADEIRSAYRKLALQRHPDKLVNSGVSEAEATASFQELLNAYEVLSDPRERAWYDSHRSQILFSGSSYSSSSRSGSSAAVPDLFSFFSKSVFSGYSDSGKGFFKVYADVFDRIYNNELNFAKKLGLGPVKEAPLMGNLKSPHAQVSAFYGYWLGFVTVMDFVWEDQYDPMAGLDRKSRRVMEDENKKIRRKAKREYNETVRNLAAFVKKRDKRVINMQMKRNEEIERQREEEKARKKEMEREKAERARTYLEPEWTKLDEEEVAKVEEVVEEEEIKNELYCAACSKKFKSDKQWKNHEQSKKHKEKVAELRKAFRDEGEENEEGEDSEEEDVFHSNEVDDGVEGLHQQFENDVVIQEEEDNDHESQSSEEEAVVDINNGKGLKGIAEELGLEDDDESGVLGAMLSGHKSRKTGRKSKAAPKNVHVDSEPEEIDLMEYNNRKGSRRNRGSRKERGKRADEDGDGEKVDIAESGNAPKEGSGYGEVSNVDEPLSSHSPEHPEQNETDGKGDADQSRRSKASKQSIEKKAKTKRETAAKLKNAPTGRKQKATSRSSSNECDTCGENFESRNRLHKHLSDTGHASLKSR